MCFRSEKSSYETVPSSASYPLKPNRVWLRRFVILNVSLILLPTLILTGSIVWTRMEVAIENVQSSGDPITYQHFFWVSVEPIPFMAYMAVPNALLGLYLIGSRTLRGR